MLPYEMNKFCWVMLFLLGFYRYWTVPLGDKLSAVMNLPDFFSEFCALRVSGLSYPRRASYLGFLLTEAKEASKCINFFCSP